MKQPSILVNYIGRSGGGAFYSYEMTKGIIENGGKVTVIIPEEIDNMDQWKQLSIDRLIVIKGYKDSKSFLFRSLIFVLWDQWKLRKLLRQEKFDFCYNPMIQPWSFLINQLVPRVKLVVTLHDPVPHSGSNKIFEYLLVKKLVAAKADKIVLLSSKFIEDTCKMYHITRDRIKIIPHGIFDYGIISNGKSFERKGQYNFLFFGRIEKYKGIQVLLEAYSKLEKEREDISLLIVGKGNMSEYKDLVAACKNIELVNRFVDDSEVASFFRGKNIITVLPYIDATQSGVIPIAMKEESLLIVSNTGGLLEQTDNGTCAITCNPEANSLYESMRYAIDNYNKCQEYITKAKDHADNLKWNALAKQLIDFGMQE